VLFAVVFVCVKTASEITPLFSFVGKYATDIYLRNFGQIDGRKLKKKIISGFLFCLLELIRHYGPTHVDYNNCLEARMKLLKVTKRLPSALRKSVIEI